MNLQISVFLSIFTAGQSLRCYDCKTSSCGQVQTCSSEFSNCLSAKYVDVSPYNTSVKKMCVPSSDCVSGSINIGIERASAYCCNTDLCNAQDALDPSTITTNGRTCYYCDEQSYSKILSCSGSEDRCITATVTFRGQSVFVKGCASRSVCYATIFHFESASCCSGNLCNGAQSVTQSFLFLCCSLLSFILLH